MTDKSRNDADTYADRLFHALSARQTLAPLTADDPGFDLAAGYAVAAALRARRGGRTVGRKIGFSNTAIWPLYGIDGPMWGWMYEGSVDVEPSEHSVPADAFVLPRIEPEILLHLTTAPSAAMDESELLACCDWIGTGFEIVQSPFPDWRFKLADAAAAGALHAGFWVTETAPVGNGFDWIEGLKTATCDLLRDGESVGAGRMDVVLGGPLLALKAILAVIENDPDAPSVAAGELIATGTLVDGIPVAAGERWESRIEGLPLGGGVLRIT